MLWWCDTQKNKQIEQIVSHHNWTLNTEHNPVPNTKVTKNKKYLKNVMPWTNDDYD